MKILWECDGKWHRSEESAKKYGKGKQITKYELMSQSDIANKYGYTSYTFLKMRRLLKIEPTFTRCNGGGKIANWYDANMQIPHYNRFVNINNFI